jgi:pilus assembly protein CpaE
MGALLASRPADAPVVRTDRTPVLAFATDEASEHALRGGLQDLAEGVQCKRGDLRACSKLLEREGTPRVLIVDVSGLDRPIQALDELAVVCTPDVRLLVIGDRTDVGFYRELTREIGALEYLYKPLTRDNVARMFGPHIQGIVGTVAPDRGGRIVTVSGARGGVGATTIAVNLALQLAETTRGHIALLDLHLRGGTAALMLGVQPGAGLRVALEHPERADALFLDRVATPVGDRLRVIAAAEPFDAEPAVTQEGIERLLSLMRTRFNTVIVDMPMPPTGPERHVLTLARQRIVVLAPDLASIRDAEAARGLNAQLAGTRTIFVLNRANGRGALKAALIRDGLGADPDCSIPDLPQLLRFANLGKPAITECAPFRRAMMPLLQEISGTVAVAKPPGLLGLLGLKGKT